MNNITEDVLRNLYTQEKKSVAAIAKIFDCSEHKVNYWLAKFAISKRTIGESVYLHHNPAGDPFSIAKPKKIADVKLFGLGLGLYWGEGTKSSKTSIRLGNTDPALIKQFIRFLEKIFGINKQKLKFGLQIFSDMPARDALRFWQKELGFSKSHFQKVVVTPARSIGTYRNKTKHGVLTLYYNNVKLRNILCQMIEKMK